MAYFRALIKKRKSYDAVSVKDKKITYPIPIPESRPLPPPPSPSPTPSDSSTASIVPATLAFPAPPIRTPLYAATPLKHRTRETEGWEWQRASANSKERSPRGSGELRKHGKKDPRAEGTRDGPKVAREGQTPSPTRDRAPAKKRLDSPKVSLPHMLPVLDIGDMIYDDSMTSSAASTAILTPHPSGQTHAISSPTPSSPMSPKPHSRHTNPTVLIHPDTSLESTVELSFSPEASPVKISRRVRAKVWDSGSAKDVGYGQDQAPAEKAEPNEKSAIVAKAFAVARLTEDLCVPAHDSIFSSDSEYSLNTSIAPHPIRPGYASSSCSITPSESSMRIPLLQRERTGIQNEILAPPTRCSSVPLIPPQDDGGHTPTLAASTHVELPSSVSYSREWWLDGQVSKDTVSLESTQPSVDATPVKPSTSPLCLAPTLAQPISSSDASTALSPTSPAFFTAQGSPSPTTAQFFSEKTFKEKVWYDVKSSRGPTGPVDPDESGSWSDGPSWAAGDDSHFGYMRITGERSSGERAGQAATVHRSKTPPEMVSNLSNEADSPLTNVNLDDEVSPLPMPDCKPSSTPSLPIGKIPSLFHAICARALQRGYLGMDDFHAERGVLEALAEDEKWLSVDHEVAREMVNLRKENTRLKAELRTKTAGSTTSTPSGTPFKRRLKSSVPPIEDVSDSTPPRAFHSTPTRTRGLHYQSDSPLSRASSSSSEATVLQAEIVQLRIELSASRNQQDQLLERAETAESSIERATESISALQSMLSRITLELEESHRRAAMDRSEMERVTAEYAEERRKGEAVRNGLKSWEEQEKDEVDWLKGEVGGLQRKVDGFFGLADTLTRCLDELVCLRETKSILEQEITAILAIQSTSSFKRPDRTRPAIRHSWTPISHQNARVERAALPPSSLSAGRTTKTD
ncbi:hypothetical protein IAR50_005789 [Cryptococcus sp. DSM 104548]